MVLNMLWQASLAGDSGSPIGHLTVAFGGAPNFDVADSLDSAYLGSFTYHLNSTCSLLPECLLLTAREGNVFTCVCHSVRGGCFPSGQRPLF